MPDAPTKTGDLVSIACLCERLQRSFSHIQRCLRQAGAEPRMILNNTRYYDWNEVSEILATQGDNMDNELADLQRQVTRLQAQTKALREQLDQKQQQQKNLEFRAEHGDGVAKAALAMPKLKRQNAALATKRQKEDAAKESARKRKQFIDAFGQRLAEQYLREGKSFTQAKKAFREQPGFQEAFDDARIRTGSDVAAEMVVSQQFRSRHQKGSKGLTQ